MRLSSISFAIFICALTVSAQIKKPEPPPVKIPFTESRQAVVVTTKDWNATQGMAHLYERASKTAKWKSKGESFPVVVGRTGLRWAPPENPQASQARFDPFRTEETFKTLDGVPIPGPPFKKEGDGRSPAGLFPLTFAFGTSMKPESLTFPYTRLGQYTECVDDVSSHHYNKIVGRDQVGIFDWKSSEKMLEIVPQYELGYLWRTTRIRSFPVTGLAYSSTCGKTPILQPPGARRWVASTWSASLVGSSLVLIHTSYNCPKPNTNR